METSSWQPSMASELSPMVMMITRSEVRLFVKSIQEAGTLDGEQREFLFLLCTVSS